jgi:hypothetical protein
VRLVVIVDFPFALLVAWVFERTPERLKRADEIAPQESIAAEKGIATARANLAQSRAEFLPLFD